MTEDPKDYLKKGIELLDTGDYQGAIQYCEKALEIDPKYAPGWNNWGNALSALARIEPDLEKARPLFGGSFQKYQEATRIKADFHEAYYNWGNALSDLAEREPDLEKARPLFEESFQKYQEATRIKADKHEAYYNWGNALSALARIEPDLEKARPLFEESCKKYAEAVKHKPDKHEAYYNWGNALYQLKKYKGAIACYDKALKIDPNDALAQGNKGAARVHLRSYKRAEKALEKAVSLDPKNIINLYNWGDALLKLGRYDEAEGAYRRAIEVRKTWRSYLGLAKVYVMLGDKGKEDWTYEEALANLNTVSELYPDIAEDKETSRDYYFQRGYVHAKLGHWREAERDFRQCRGDPKAERNIRRIRNRVKGEGQPPWTILWGGRAVAGISAGWLIFVCIWYFCRLDLRLLKMAPIDAELLKVLVPTFLFFMAVGASLPYIRSIKGPAGIGFEKEITIRPESAPSGVRLEGN